MTFLNRPRSLKNLYSVEVSEISFWDIGDQYPDHKPYENLMKRPLTWRDKNMQTHHKLRTNLKNSSQNQKTFLRNIFFKRPGANLFWWEEGDCTTLMDRPRSNFKKDIITILKHAFLWNAEGPVPSTIKKIYKKIKITTFSKNFEGTRRQKGEKLILLSKHFFFFFPILLDIKKTKTCKQLI